MNIQEALAIVRREMLWTYENIIYTQRHEREIIPGMRDAWDHPTIVEQRGKVIVTIRRMWRIAEYSLRFLCLRSQTLRRIWSSGQFQFAMREAK